MEQGARTNNWRLAELLGALVIVAGVAAFVSTVVQAGVDRNRRCVENVTAILRPVNLYIQDYDENYPPAFVWNNPSRFRTEIGLYTNDQSIFRCPATNGAFYTVNPAIAGQNQASLDIENLELLEDSVAHPDGKKTIVFLDGHSTRGGVEQFVPSVDAVCGNRLSQISLALSMYAQDYDEQYPFQTNDSRFREAIYPYVKTQRIWSCPDTAKLYKLGQAFRGKSIADFEQVDISKVVVATDAQAHRSGAITTTYLDGHTVQRGPRSTVTQFPGNVSPSLAQQSQNKLKNISYALLQYTQDYDDTLPPLRDVSSLRELLSPYVYNINVFDPVTPGGVPFQLNTVLGGTKLSSYPDISQVIWIKDINNNGGRLITAGYLDGHVRRIASP